MRLVFVAGAVLIAALAAVLVVPRVLHGRRVDAAQGVIHKYKAEVSVRVDALEETVKGLAALELREPSPMPLPDFAVITADPLRDLVGLERRHLDTAVVVDLRLRDAIALIRTGKTEYGEALLDDAAAAEAILRPVAAVRHVLVVDTQAYAEPRMLDDATTFAPGAWTGKVFLFELPTRTYLGGWIVTAESSQQVARTFGGGDAGSLLSIRSDHANLINASIRTSVARHLAPN